MLLLVALVAAPVAAQARDATVRPAWWWTPEYAATALRQAPRNATSAACAGVGRARFPLAKALSVSPTGELGYGTNDAEILTQVPKYRRFRCLVRFPKGARQGWLVVDLIPRGPGTNQLSLRPTAGFRTIEKAVEYR